MNNAAVIYRMEQAIASANRDIERLRELRRLTNDANAMHLLTLTIEKRLRDIEGYAETIQRYYQPA